MPEQPQSEADFEREEEEAAAAEAGAIGGRVTYDPPLEDDVESDPAQRAVIEGGEGESEGFELAEQELEEHASHGDQHSPARILQDAPGYTEDARAAVDGEPDEAELEDA